MPAQRKRECFHSLSVRLRQPEQSRLAQTVEQRVELCNDVVRTGCVCYRCRRFRTCTCGAGRAGGADCTRFTCRAGRAGWANCACFSCGAGRAGGADCACCTGGAGRAGSADCACGSGRAGRAGRTDGSRKARRSRRTRNASRPHWPHRSPFSSRSVRTRRAGRSHRARSVVAHHRIAHALLPAFARAFPVAAAVLSIVHVVLPFLPICRKSPAVQSMPKAALR